MVAVIVGVLAVLTFVPSGAFAVPGVTLFHIRGTVTDVIGRPLAGARVDDGNQSVLTAADGTYELPEENSGTYDITAVRADTSQSTVTVGATIPVDKTADFTLSFRIYGSLSDFYLSTASGPATSTLTLTSWAPLPGSPGGTGGKSCVSVTDSRTAISSPATFDGTNGEGSQRWLYTLAAPQGATEGFHRLTSVASDCATGTVLTNSSQRSYSVDNTAPVISAPFPTAWTTSSTTVGALVKDTGTAGVDHDTVMIAVDGTSHPASISYSQTRSLALSGLADGLHTATISATDRAGNEASPLNFTFTVDGGAPELSAPTPTGTVTASSPRIAISALDVDSGIDPASVAMTLSNGLVTHAVTATYDATSDTISYQVPTTVQAAGLGQFPLLDGTYTVQVAVRDIVGNLSTQSWTFAVHTLPTI